MRQPLLGVAWLVTVAGTLLLHRPSLDSMKNPYQRGTYAILVDAEQALAKGHSTLALADLRAAFVRGQYEGQVGVAERVRWRMARAGSDLLAHDSSEAWPFLESYALLSDDFGRDAMAVEGLFLQQRSGVVPRFTYRLTRSDGESFWGDPWTTEWTGLWTIWRWWDSIRGNSVIWGVSERGGLHAEIGPEGPDARFSSETPLFLRPGPNPPSGTVIVEAPAASGPLGCWFSMASTFNPAAAFGPNRWMLTEFTSSFTNYIPRVAVFTDALPSPKGSSILLVRDYQPLPSEDF